MAYRYKMSRGKSRRQFRRTAKHVHKKNSMSPVARGGIRF